MAELAGSVCCWPALPVSAAGSLSIGSRSSYWATRTTGKPAMHEVVSEITGDAHVYLTLFFGNGYQRTAVGRFHEVEAKAWLPSYPSWRRPFLTFSPTVLDLHVKIFL